MTWTIVFLLILINALYVLAEFGAVSVRRIRVRQLAEDGHALAQWLLPHIEDPQRLDRYVAACQIGITWSSLVLGAFGQATLARQLGPVLASAADLGPAAALTASAVVVLVGLSAAQVVLGELLPKSLALQFPTQAALYTVLPMRWSLLLYTWFIAILNGSGQAILALLGMRPTGHRHIHSPEEIDLLIAESRDGGLLEPDEQQRLHRALQLSARRVRQLMVPRLQMDAVDVQAKVEVAVRAIAASPYTRLPVYEGTLDTIVGIVHTRDVTRQVLALQAEGAPMPEDLIRVTMRPPLQVPETLRADRLLALFREHRTQMAIVIDELGGVAGLVNLDDILKELLGHVPAARAGELTPQRLPDGRLLVPGRMRLHEAEPWIGVAWGGEADTVGGRVVEALGHLPESGERVTIDGVEVEVIEVRHRAVASVAVRPVVPAGRGAGEEMP